MSYSKLEKEVNNVLPKNYNGRKDNPALYYETKKAVIENWMEAKRYRELISVAHGEWLREDALLHPLADRLVKEGEDVYLKFLYERKIRSNIRSLLFLMKLAKKQQPNYTLNDVLSVDLEKYKDSTRYDTLAETKKWMIGLSNRLEEYLSFLGRLSQDEYYFSILNLKEKLETFKIKAADLKLIQTKL